MTTQEHITIRTMYEADAGAVSRIVSADYADVARQEGFSDVQTECLLNERASISNIRDWMTQWQCFVAESCGVIVGALAVERNDIAEIWVDPRHQSKGIGTDLFQHAEQIIAEEGFQELTARCAASGARPFYEAMGCELAGVKPCLAGPLAGWPLAHYHKELKP